MPRLIRIVGPALLVVIAAIMSLLAALEFGGGAAAPLLLDPGAVVRFGLPMAKLLVNLGAAGTIGALVLVCLALDASRREFSLPLDIAAGAAGVWAISSAFTGFFSFLAAFNQPLAIDDAFGDLISRFLTTTELGQAWLATTLIAAGVTVLCFAVRNLTVLAFVTAFAVVGLVPMSLQGHAGGTEDHDAATMAVFLHVLFAAVWLGGLVVILLIKSTLGAGRTGLVLSRYSTLALICFIVVAASGYISAEIRVESVENLLTPYGILVIVKIIALVSLGLFGAVQRTFFIKRMLAGSERYFWWIVSAELVFMGIASGVAAALARTATPKPEVSASQLEDPTAAELLTGRPVPLEPIADTWLTTWSFDLLWILVCGFAVFFYIAAVLRLRKRGDVWPLYRTLLWVAGIALLFYVTNGAVNLYQEYLFSAHMLAHMTLGMIIPLLLVPGAPVTLALRTIGKRSDGSRGPREWILLAVHSRVFGVLSNPVVAAVLFVGSLWAFYYTPLFRWATTDHIGHEWMIVHFVATGYLFVQSMIGIDPAPSRAPYPLRLIILLATMAFHAFFGLAIMTGTGLLLADWYGAMGRDWGPSAIADQQAGGAIAWSVGEIPTLILAVVVAIMWSRSDDRESKRLDRKADRDGEADLEEYNRMLARRGSSPGA